MFTQLARPTARRRQGSVLGALLLFMACTARTTTMTDADLTNFATRYAAAWSSRDPARFAALYSEGGTLAVNGGAPSVGRGAIMATAQVYMTAFPDMRVTLDSVRRQDGHSVFHWTWTGTNTGPGGTGKAVRLHGYER